MGVSNFNKEFSVSRISCGESFQVKLSLTAEPDIKSNPADMVLILDRSGSMAGSPLANLKNGAKKFIEIIDEATDEVKDGQIGYGSRIGIVSFSDTAVQDTQLITSVEDLNAAVNALSAGGSTNHRDAFTKAMELFDPDSENAKFMIMFTDGRTTAGGDAAPVAAAAKAAGVLIYCIGLDGRGGLDIDALNEWASDPDSAYVAITPDESELEDLFENLARNIVKPGATNIVIDEKVLPCFKIVSLLPPTAGVASLIDATSLQWKIDKLGVDKSEGAVLEFEVKHVGPCSGTMEVNESLTYHDDEGNSVEIPNPEMTVECGVVVLPEECPEPVALSIDGCEDTVEFDAGALDMESLGRILQVSVTLKKICPHRKVALAVLLSELDQYGHEHSRGMKTMTVPAHTQSGCRDITVKCIKFVLPECFDSSCKEHSICEKRKFKVRMIAHYIDNDFECCKQVK
jgi:uncharacterized protein YegL